MSAALVSIGIPVFNGAKWLPKTIDALLNQTYSPIELIISDNASTDRTAVICREYVARDKRVRYFRHDENHGAARNYQYCLEQASGDYFKWNAASDIALPGMVEACVAVLEQREDVVLCCSQTTVVGIDGVEERHIEKMVLDQGDPLARLKSFFAEIRLNHMMNGVARRQALVASRKLRTYFSSDYVLMAELLLRGRVVYLPDFLFIRNNQPGAASALESTLVKQRYIDPQLKSRLLFQKNRQHFAYFAAANRAPLSIKDRFRINAYLARRTISIRHKLLSDFISSIKRLRQQRST